MIESVRIRNFQRHENLTVEFGRITSVVGRSDSGKSAVIRALRWLATNKPAGSAFLRHGASFVRVAIVVDGRTVVRRRKGSKNSYKVDGETYPASGASIPSAVGSLLNLGEQNWQGQHDSPFWFGCSAGEVSRELNAIVNLGTIDRSLAFVASELRRSRASVEEGESRLRDAESAVGRLEWVAGADRSLNVVERLIDRLKETSRKRDAVASLAGSARRVVDDGRHAGKVAVDAEDVVRLSDRVIERRETADQLRQLRRRIASAFDGRRDLERKAKKAAAVWAEAAGSICETCGRPFI